MDVAKAFNAVCVIDLLYKLTSLNFPFHLVKIISSYLDCRTFQMSFHSAISTRRGHAVSVVKGGLVSPVQFSLFVNDIPKPSRHVELAHYVDDTALVATSQSPSRLVIWRPISVELSSGYGIGGLSSASQIVSLCSLLILRDAYKSLDQSSFSEGNTVCRNSTIFRAEP
jgi:hypothetical protein